MRRYFCSGFDNSRCIIRNVGIYSLLFGYNSNVALKLQQPQFFSVLPESDKFIRKDCILSSGGLGAFSP